jgi:hypothetical protein
MRLGLALPASTLSHNKTRRGIAPGGFVAVRFIAGSGTSAEAAPLLIRPITGDYDITALVSVTGITQFL